MLPSPHTDGLDDTSWRNLREEALLKIQGITGFTFQMAVQKVDGANAFRFESRGFGIKKAQEVVKSGSGGRDAGLLPRCSCGSRAQELLPKDRSHKGLAHTQRVGPAG